MLSTFVAIGPWITSRITGIARPPKASTTSWPGSIVRADGGEGRAEDAEPDGRDELSEHAAEVELAARHAPGDEPRVVGGVGEPGDAPADADRGHQRGHRAPQRLAVQPGAGVAPVDVGLVVQATIVIASRTTIVIGTVQRSNRAMARKPIAASQTWIAMIRIATRDLEAVAAVDADLVEERDDQVEDDPGVDRAPADGQQALHGGRKVGAAPAERRAREHHLADRCLLAHQHEEAEDRHPDHVADDEHADGLPQARARGRCPRAPSTQLIGAMLAPVQIQNWWATVEVRAFSGMGTRVCSTASVTPSSSALIDTVPPGLAGVGLPGSQFPPCIESVKVGCRISQRRLVHTPCRSRGGWSCRSSRSPGATDGEVGPRLRQLRDLKALSARQVAERAGRVRGVPQPPGERPGEPDRRHPGPPGRGDGGDDGDAVPGAAGRRRRPSYAATSAT